MAKTPNSSNKTTSNPKPKSQSPSSTTPKSKAKARPTKKDNEERVAAERRAIYEQHQERIDDAIAKCLKHFKDDEPDIVRAVARMLFDEYSRKRMKSHFPEFHTLLW